MKFDAAKISEMLAERAYDVAVFLLPKGKKVGQQWQAGSVNGEPGKSLNVQIRGAKAGIWCDFASGERGDLLSLWQSTKKLTFTSALQEACKFLGIEAPNVGNFSQSKKQTKIEYKKPSKTGIRKAVVKLYEYFLYRGIDQCFVDTFKVCSDEKSNIVFPYIKHDGELAGIKYLNPKAWNGEDRNKWWKQAGCEPCLWGWQSFDENMDEVVMTEGEIDAMSIYACGYPALSIPSGAADIDSWLETEYDNLQRFKTIRLCLDNDDPGIEATEKIAKRLGIHRILFVNLNEKDANDVLVKHGKDALINLLNNASPRPPSTIKRPSDYLPELLKAIDPNYIDLGTRLPWEKCLDKFIFRPCELTIWTGWNGNGKSELLNFVGLNGLRNGEKWMYYTPEMRPRNNLKRLLTQIYGRDFYDLTAQELKYGMDFLDSGFYYYDTIRSQPIEQILESFLYARNRFNVFHFVIDSLQKCGLPEGGDGELAAQKRFMDRLCEFKDENECHIHLVAHPRKSKDDLVAANKMDVKGSGSITDLADNVLSVQRNRIKEKTVDKGISQLASDKEKAEYNEICRQPDVSLEVQKQRNGDWEGSIDLWYSTKHRQYLSSAIDEPRRFLPAKKEN